MDKEKAKALLPIITAMIEGKTIQVKIDGEWSCISDPSFTGPLESYRIKPEPRVMYFVEWKGVRTSCNYLEECLSETAAQNRLGQGAIKIVKFVEQL